MSSNSPSPIAATAVDLRTQYAALCWRMRDGKVEVLVITSRDTGRWIIPKGWPMEGLTPMEAAAQEAFEEAGVKGRADASCLGYYPYEKALSRDPKQGLTVACMVAVYPLRVARLVARYPESKLRRRKWVSPAKAARLVDEPELQALIAGFAPLADPAGESVPS